ncbi:MAG: thiol reductase thioredoxin [Myxococcales bacterium]|nr:thiol reductase thioredoxin [Myxococcales bacterium]
MRSLTLLLVVGVSLVAGAEVPPSRPISDAQNGKAKEVLSFVEDDYGRALAEAKKRHLPLFVDAWAPWCHTCRFMQSYVFNDPSLGKQATRFVFLSIDTEKEKNAPFLAKYPIEVWPTLMVVDPAREQAVLRWPGSVNAAQLVKLLDDGEHAVHADGKDAVGELARADRLAGEGRAKDAAAAYRAVLPRLPAEKRPRATESLLAALMREPESCAQTGVELVPPMARGPSFANATALALGCATELKGDARSRALAVLEPLGVEAVALPGLLADDRSGLYETLVGIREEAKDAAGKKVLAARWLAFLDGEAARAPTVEQRAAFDPHRVNAALALGEPLRVVPALQASEKELPNDYNPAARLALLYRAAGKYDDALHAIDRALPKAYGPRAVRLYDLKVDLQLKKNDSAGAKKTLQQALVVAKALPAEQRPEQSVAAMQKRLQSMP